MPDAVREGGRNLLSASVILDCDLAVRQKVQNDVGLNKTWIYFFPVGTVWIWRRLYQDQTLREFTI